MIYASDGTWMYTRRERSMCPVYATPEEYVLGVIPRPEPISVVSRPPGTVEEDRSVERFPPREPPVAVDAEPTSR